MLKESTSISFYTFYIDLKRKEKNISQQSRYLNCQFNSKREEMKLKLNALYLKDFP